MAYEKGGSLLKFGGDALLLVFSRGEHAVLGAEAAVAMRAALREARTLTTSVGRINLKMSVGLHSGDLLLFRVGEAHHEMIVTGPVATVTTEMEHAADAGEILISPAMASHLPKSSVGEAKGPGVLLRGRRVVEGGPGPEPMRAVPEEMVSASIPTHLRRRLADPTAESEHRTATVGFVKFVGVDDLLATQGPDATAAALDAVVRAVQVEADAEGVTFLASDIDANGGKIILTTGVPYAAGGRRGSDAPCRHRHRRSPLRARGARRGEHRPRLRRRHRDRLPPHLHRDGRHGEPGGPADGRRIARPGAGHCRRARPGRHALPDRAAPTLHGQGEVGAGAGLCRRSRHRSPNVLLRSPAVPGQGRRARPAPRRLRSGGGRGYRDGGH